MKRLLFLIGFVFTTTAFAQNFYLPAGCCVPKNPPQHAAFCASWNQPQPGADRFNRCIQAHDNINLMCEWDYTGQKCESGATGDPTGEGDGCCYPTDPANASICAPVNGINPMSARKTKCEATGGLCAWAPANAPQCKPTPPDEPNDEPVEGCCAPKSAQYASTCAPVNGILPLSARKQKCDATGGICIWSPANSPLCLETQGDPTGQPCPEGSVEMILANGLKRCCDKPSNLNEKQCREQGGTFGISNGQPLCCGPRPLPPSDPTGTSPTDSTGGVKTDPVSTSPGGVKADSSVPVDRVQSPVQSSPLRLKRR